MPFLTLSFSFSPTHLPDLTPARPQPRQSIPRGCVRQERKDVKRVRMSLCKGFTLLRFEDNKRGICGDPGQEQSSRSRSEHPLHSLSIPLSVAHQVCRQCEDTAPVHHRPSAYSNGLPAIRLLAIPVFQRACAPQPASTKQI